MTADSEIPDHEPVRDRLAPSGGLSAALAEQLRAAPWFASSLGIHLALLVILMAMPTTPADGPKKAPPMIIEAVDDPEPVDEETPPEEIDEIVDIVEMDVPIEPVAQSETLDFNDVQDFVTDAPDSPVETMDFEEVVVPVIGIPDVTSPAAQRAKGGLFSQRQGSKTQRINRLGGNARLLDAATRAALNWLKFHQPDTGLYGHHCSFCRDGHGHQITEDPAYLASATAMAALAFMGYGSSPTKGEFRAQVRKAIDALLPIQNARTGEFVVAERKDKGGCPTARPYAHAIVLMAVAEAQAMSPNAKYKTAVRKGVEFAVSRQRDDGGWFDAHTPAPKSSDVTTSGWYVMALVQARNAGVSVPADCLRRARRFLQNTAFDDRRKDKQIRTGLFVEGGKPVKHEWTMDALNLTALQFLGVDRRDPKVRTLADTVQHTLGGGKVSTMGGRSWNFFGQYFAALGLFQFGANQMPGARNEFSAAWNVGYKHVIEMVPATQIMGKSTVDRHRGSWNPMLESAHGPFGGRVGLTAAGALITEVFYRYDFVTPLNGRAADAYGDDGLEL